MADLDKYSSSIKLKDLSPLRFKTALGKDLPKEDPASIRLARIAMLDLMLKDVKSTDWAETQIYFQYTKNKGRWKHEDNKIYSELELRVFAKTIEGMITRANSKEFNANEGKDILKKHVMKTFTTLEILCHQTNLNYFYHRSKINYEDAPIVESLLLLMERCIKLYMLIDSFMKVFNLLEKKD